MARTIHCIKLDKEAEGLDFPPYPGELGKKIWETVSKEAWAAWLKHQTMLVNENRLNLADVRARKYLATQMEKHFFGEGADAAQGYAFFCLRNHAALRSDQILDHCAQK
eukprot:gene55783-74488_t